MVKLPITPDKTTFIAIDTNLRPSLYKRLVWGLTLLGFMLILSVLPLSISYKIGIAITALVALWFGQLYRHHLLAMSALKATHSRSSQSASKNEFGFLQWQLQLARGVITVPWGSQKDIWQAVLTAISDMGGMVILTFYIIEPQPQTISVTVWQDQVDRDTWRQFKVLANTLGR